MTTATIQTTIERYAPALTDVGVEAASGTVKGRAVPYNTPDDRPGIGWRITPDGDWPEPVRYAYSIFESGCFDEWLAGAGATRVRFMFQHGDAGESWTGNPMGLLSLPIGKVNEITNEADGLYFAADFADHPVAQWVRSLAESSALTDLSFAQWPSEVTYEVDDKGQQFRRIVTAELWDISIVVWGQFADNAMITEAYSKLRAQEPNNGDTVPAANPNTLNATSPATEIAGATAPAVDDAQSAEAVDGTAALELASVTASNREASLRAFTLKA
jgi:HK97 family phage prohead protease